ncbi:MAG: glucosylglycerol-phosphate synthase [Leptolyngbyaceae cyanobacterium MO_188.B28]|nr:glucosylglycerol-phosphate synthase [Leptolyngbyaceae cyanobacterium MO_188.B28]
MSNNPSKSSLVILYHREPYDEVVENGRRVYREKKSPNGILPTLKSFFSSAEASTWIAWKKISGREKANFQADMTYEGAGVNCVVHRIPLSAEQVRDFYHITSKEAFWPILHTFPEKHTSDSANWENFKHINRLFAEAACTKAAEDALIWIHDYNLWMAPYYIRQKMPHVRIAFFHHTPFPSPDTFNILPWREEIIESLLCCDLCGFHIPRYAENFVHAARSLRPVAVLRRTPVSTAFTPSGAALAEPEITTQLKYGDRLINVDAFPVGANPKLIHSILEQPAAQQSIQAIREQIGDNTFIISASRVDYTKGNCKMLLAFERLLDRRPDLRGKINLMAITVKSAAGMRVYRTVQREIEQMVGRINGRFARLSWTPIKFSTEPIPYETLIAYMKAADIAWITPLRDGLNLVAKEYVIAHGGQDGALVLSEFAGASVELPGAVLTNPYSQHSMDAAIDQALAMPRAEQKARMEPMYQAMCRYDVKQWANHVCQEAQARSVDLKQQSEEKGLALV